MYYLGFINLIAISTEMQKSQTFIGGIKSKQQKPISLFVSTFHCRKKKLKSLTKIHCLSKTSKETKRQLQDIKKEDAFKKEEV